MTSRRRPADSVVRRLFQAWLAGASIFARFLWFSFNLILAMLPLHLVVDQWINPGESVFLPDGGIHLRGILTLLAFVLYAPLAALLASRFSRQTLSKRCA